MKKFMVILLALALSFSLVACSKNDDKNVDENKDNVEATDTKEDTKNDAEENDNKDKEDVDSSVNKDIKVAMVTDDGGVNDQSFNQSAWEALQKFNKDFGNDVRYIESHKSEDYRPNFQALLENDSDLMWGIGYKLEKDATEAAKQNPDKHYGIIDSVSSENLDNMVSVIFKAEQPSFLVGYIAGMMTETDKVGFVGGIEGDVIWGFEYGYKAGVEYAAKELGKEIEVMSQYAESFVDAAKGKAIAKRFFESGADIVFHAAGGVGDGIIEAAKEADKWAIGVDKDQNYLAPDNVLTSAMKRVDIAVYDISKEFAEGKFEPGLKVYSLENGGVDIAPTSDKHVPKEVLDKIEGLKEKIISGEIKVPNNEETYEEYKN